MRKRDTLEKQTSLNHACFAYNLFVYSKPIIVGVKWATWDPFHIWRPTKLCETNNTAPRLQFKNRNIRFEKFIKSAIKLLDEYLYFCVNSQLHVVNIHTSTKIQVRVESIHHFDYVAKYSLE
jgi:hypothetical protein